MKTIFKAFMFWITISNKYDNIKKDPKRSATSVILGVTSIIMSVVGIAATVGFALLAYYCFSSMDNLLVLFALIGGIACVGAAVVCFVNLVLASIMYAVYQLKLNKRAIGKIALFTSLLISVGTVVLIIIALTL